VASIYRRVCNQVSIQHNGFGYVVAISETLSYSADFIVSNITLLILFRNPAAAVRNGKSLRNLRLNQKASFVASGMRHLRFDQSR
jgi:hypothetical protein